MTETEFMFLQFGRLRPRRTMLKRTAVFLLLGCALALPAWARVLVRWTEPALPGKSLGVSELVIPFDPEKIEIVQKAARQGYRVYIETAPDKLSDAEKLSGTSQIAGIVVDPGNVQAPAIDRQKLQAAHPKLNFVFLTSGGKQPQMRGQTVTTSNGVLQVSSPTAQPWLDSNLAMVRFQQAANALATPAYTFKWELNDSVQQQNGPTFEDYALAINESGALHADLVLDIHPALQKSLLAGDAASWTTWNKLLAYLKFASGESRAALKPWSNIGIFADNYDAAFEPANLMARHNIPFRVLTSELNTRTLENLKTLVALTPPTEPAIQPLTTFADRGGTVIVVEAKGKYPWQSAQPVQTSDSVRTYAVGKGKVHELAEPISDPEAFAEDVRRLTPKSDALITLWNALTTIAVPYRDDRTGEVVIDLANFAEDPIRVQVELKGTYSQIRYETPEHGCCQDLSPVRNNGFTDFIVPSLFIAGRVHLRPGAANPHSNQQ